MEGTPIMHTDMMRLFACAHLIIIISCRASLYDIFGGPTNLSVLADIMQLIASSSAIIARIFIFTHS